MQNRILAATNVTVINDTTVTVTAPAHLLAGAVNVILTTPIATATLTNGYTYSATPSLLSLSTNGGNISGGNTVTLTGVSFTNVTGVTFGGVAATNIVTVNSTSVTVTVPTHAAGAVDVVLTTLSGSSTLSSSYTYAASPTLSSISPNSGLLAGLTAVTLTGNNLSASTAVTFGGVAATAVIVVSNTSVTVLTPAHAAGAVNVILTTNAGSALLTNSFTYKVI